VVAGGVAGWFEDINVVSFRTEGRYKRIVHASGTEGARDEDNTGLGGHLLKF
jgi:hypothetical protein